MRTLIGFLLIVLVLAGCNRLPHLDSVNAPERTPPPPCPTHRIRFTQETGCQNDGSVEFCLAAGDLVALESVRALAQDVRCMRAGGRARCDLDTEVLCMVETRGLCVTHHGALTDAGWALVCDLAALDAVREIVPTWYE
jgi:hypothetical protein